MPLALMLLLGGVAGRYGICQFRGVRWVPVMAAFALIEAIYQIRVGELVDSLDYMFNRKKCGSDSVWSWGLRAYGDISCLPFGDNLCTESFRRQ